MTEQRPPPPRKRLPLLLLALAPALPVVRTLPPRRSFAVAVGPARMLPVPAAPRLTPCALFQPLRVDLFLLALPPWVISASVTPLLPASSMEASWMPAPMGWWAMAAAAAAVAALRAPLDSAAGKRPFWRIALLPAVIPSVIPDTSTGDATCLPLKMALVRLLPACDALRDPDKRRCRLSAQSTPSSRLSSLTRPLARALPKTGPF